MKKFNCFLIGLALLISGLFVFVPNNQNPIDAAELSTSNIQNLSATENYDLTRDLDCSRVTGNFTPVQNYSGVFDGRGNTIKNLTITLNSQYDKAGFFGSTNGATIKNLRFENITININYEVDLQTIKIGALIGEATGTKIENCSIIGNSSVFVKGISSMYVGNLVGEIVDGTQISNCLVSSNLKVIQSGLSTNKTFYVGGLVGKQSNATVKNVIVSSDISVASESTSNSAVGGVVGFVAGYNTNKTKTTNSIYLGQLNEGIDNDALYLGGNVGSFVGKVSCKTDEVPVAYSLNYFHSNSDYDFFGNKAEIEQYQDVINFPLTSLTLVNNEQTEYFLRQEFYTDETQWDFETIWDFNNTWIIQDKVELPKLQTFESFVYELSEDASFTSIEKPVLSSGNNVINFEESELTFDYGKSIEISGYITNENRLNKFFEITGLRKDTIDVSDNIVFDNKQVLNIVDNAIKGETVQEVTDSHGQLDYTKYSFGGNVVCVKDNSTDNVAEKSYWYEGGNIVWKNKITETLETNTYTMNNCNATNQGTYSFVLETKKYTLTVSTENEDKGTIRRGTAETSVRDTMITDTISYGQKLSYIATPTEDFAFDAWTLDLENEEAKLTGKTTNISFTFDENAFMEGGIFASLELGTDELCLYSLYTKNICEITFKFAINGTITDQNLSTISVDGRRLEVNENGVYTFKAKRGADYSISVILPAGYEFTSWFESDGTANVNDLGTEMERTIQANAEDTMILVADFYQEVVELDNNSTLIWIIVGSVSGIIVAVVIIVVLVRKKKDNSYKNFY